MWELILKWLVPFLCGGAVSAIIAYFTMFKAVRNGVQCLLRSEIIAMYKEYQHKHFCPIYAKESLRRMYAAYHKLGGNDVATELYEKTIALAEELPDKEGV